MSSATRSDPYVEPTQPVRSTELLGALELVTPASGSVLEIEPLRKWLRVDHALDNDQIGDLLEVATVFCETEISGHRQIRQAVYDLPARCWWAGELCLPRPPLSSVLSVKYYDTQGSEQTLASSFYLVRTPWRAPGTIERAPDQTWPGLQGDRSHPVTIRFRAGYASGSVPATIKQAIRFLVTQWYEQRLSVGKADKETVHAVSCLLQSDSYGSYK